VQEVAAIQEIPSIIIKDVSRRRSDLRRMKMILTVRKTAITMRMVYVVRTVFLILVCSGRNFVVKVWISVIFHGKDPFIFYIFAKFK